MSVDYIDSIKNSKNKREALIEAIKEMLSPLYIEGDVIFGFDISEKWNIAVYLYDEADGHLKPIWREKSASHPSQTLGRPWRPGEGHVGKAFLDRRPILTGNANEESVAQLCKARDSKRMNYDDQVYVSFASVPIYLSADDSINPYGVLVVTSNVEGRLSDEAPTELLMHFAETLAVILRLSEQQMDCFIYPNQDTIDPTGEKNDEK